MKFTCNTKPFSEALSLSVISANVSNFHKKSTLVQLTASNNTLRINVEAAQIVTEVQIKGSCDVEGESSILVSSLSLKQLVSTFDSDTVDIEFTDTGLVLHSNRSKFTLPKLVDSDELELLRPQYSEGQDTEFVEIDNSDWKFIKDYQLYALAMSFIHPVYTRVWIGADGDVIVGDYDNSLFTHSKHAKLGTTCLLSDTIINLFTTLPTGSKLAQNERSYIVKFDSDSISYTTQFTPVYESDEGVGSYNSDIFLNMMSNPVGGVEVNAASISKFINQADMLSSSTEDAIKFSVSGGVLSLQDSNVDCKLDVQRDSEVEFEVEFKIESLRKVVANYGDGIIHILPLVQDGETSGILVWNDELTTVLAGVE